MNGRKGPSAVALPALGRAVLASAVLCSAALAEPPDGSVLFARLHPLMDNVESGALVGAVQPDGRIVVAGYQAYSKFDVAFVLMRLLESGDLDPTFGDGGVVLGPGWPLSSFLVAVDLVVDPADGGIVVLGNSFWSELGPGPTLVRFLPDGTLDTGFGGDGFVPFDFGDPESSPSVRDLELLPDGRLVVAGATEHPSGNPGFGVARFHPDGTPDSTLDGDGNRTFQFLGGSGGATGLAVRPDGRIVLVGDTPIGSGSVAVAALLPDGAFDPSFGTGGLALVEWNLTVPGIERSRRCALAPDGGLYLGAEVCTSFDGEDCPTTTWGVARLTGSGQLDPSFGGDGRVHGEPCEPLVCGTLFVNPRMAVQGNDLPLVVRTLPGTAPGDTDIGVLRLTRAGEPDAGFGTGGWSMIEFDGSGDRADRSSDVVLAPDGRIVLAGASRSDPTTHFAVVRLANALVFADGVDSGSTAAWSGVEDGEP